LLALIVAGLEGGHSTISAHSTLGVATSNWELLSDMLTEREPIKSLSVE
jgi:hypothetical protein